MTDVYAEIRTADPAVLETLIAAMEARAGDPQQRAIRDRLFRAARFPEGARVLEAGCGSGAICRDLAGRAGVGAVVGVDPSPVFIGRARELAAGIANLAFEEGDARELSCPDASFDAVVFHTCLSHVPRPEAALAEAFRVLRPEGRLVILEGDYATTTVAIGPEDPLEACADAAMAALVNDRWLVRRLPWEVARAGFALEGVESHGYLQTAAPDYLLGIVTRGADFLEARRRVAEGRFFGFIGFAGLVASRPA